MKLVTLLFMLTLSLQCQSQSVAIEHDLSFPNTPALKHWAEKEFFGGGQIDFIADKGKEIVIVRRSFTSGIATCAFSVFIKSTDGWQEGLKLRTYHGYWLDFSQNGDNVVVLEHENKSEILNFSIAGLTLQKFQIPKK